MLSDKINQIIKKFKEYYKSLQIGYKSRIDIIKGHTKLPDVANNYKIVKLTLDILSIICFFVFLVFLINTHNKNLRYMPKVDEFAKYDIVAPYSIKIIDEAKTQALKEELIKSVPDKYKFDETVLPSILKNINEIFEFIKITRLEHMKQKLSDEAIENKIQNVKISFNAFKAALETSDEVLLRAQNSLEKIIKSIMASEVSESKLREVSNEAIKRIKMTPFNEKIQQIMIDIFEQNIRPNYVYDKQATQKARNKLLADVVAIERHIRAGEIIVRRGEIIKKEHIDILNKFYSDENKQNKVYSYISSALIVLFVMILVTIYLIQNHEQVLRRKSLLIMMSLIVTSIIIIARCVNYFSPENKVLLDHENMMIYSPYIVPVSSAAILIAILINHHLAFIINIVVSVLVDITLNHNNYNYLITNILSGTIAILNVKNVNHRVDITKAGIMVSFSNVFLIIAYSLFDYDVLNLSYKSEVTNDIIWGFFNGFISAIFSIGLLPYLESIFKVSSSMRLLELSDLNQPLLRRLLVEAPGTYHHSIIVGNLAEAVAKEVGADALLCRVGAYYHDIGKLKRPGFFIENQTCGVNVHDNIKPSLSAKAIMSHTKDGYEIGIEYQLPQEILDIILQHHGTNLISYFYSKALETSSSKEELNEGEYRYQGPKPQTKEAAIILLVDAVEAAFRTLTKPSPSAIESLVKKIKNERFNDGQFDECNVTLKDLEKMSVTLIKIINGMYHSRIEYPEIEKNSKNKLNFNENENTCEKNNSSNSSETNGLK